MVLSTPILVTGAAGMLGSAVMRAASMLGIEVVGLTRQDCDIGDRIRVREVLARYQDPVVINCAGIVRERFDTSFIDMRRINALGPMMLAKHAARLVHVSTDCVFDGTIQEGGYDEDAKPHPDDPYGEHKLAGEAIPDPQHLVVRASFIGLGQRGLLHWLLSHPYGARVPGFTNWIWNGWTTTALAPMLLALAQSDISGLVHLPGPAIVSKAWLLKQVAWRLRPDLEIVDTEAPVWRRMVLSTARPPIPFPDGFSMWRMLDTLAAEYRIWRL